MKNICKVGFLVTFLVLCLTSCSSFLSNYFQPADAPNPEFGRIWITNVNDTDVYWYALFPPRDGNPSRVIELAPHKVTIGNLFYQNTEYELYYIKAIIGEINRQPGPSSRVTIENLQGWSKKTGTISPGEVIKIQIP